MSMTIKDVMMENHLQVLTMQTIYNWMASLKCKYEPRKKTYFVDGHENEKTVLDRIRYCKKYIKEECRCYRWVQMNEEEVDSLCEADEKFDRKIGYKYSKNGRTFYEYHVDDHNSLQIKCNTESYFGGNLSIRCRVGEQPIIKIGQDESIFKQFVISKSKWYLPDGTTNPDPKTEGDGVLINIPLMTLPLGGSELCAKKQKGKVYL